MTGHLYKLLKGLSFEERFESVPKEYDIIQSCSAPRQQHIQTEDDEDCFLLGGFHSYEEHCL